MAERSTIPCFPLREEAAWRGQVEHDSALPPRRERTRGAAKRSMNPFGLLVVDLLVLLLTFDFWLWFWF
jgi:hypothetical protein